MQSIAPTNDGDGVRTHANENIYRRLKTRLSVMAIDRFVLPSFRSSPRSPRLASESVSDWPLRTAQRPPVL
jgi:hypothetical protein